MTWIQLELEVETPIFNSGAKGPELRVPSIIGATRYWLRALVSGLLDDHKVVRLEQRILGGIDGDSGFASPLQFRLVKHPETRDPEGISGLVRSGSTQGLAYLCGLGLYESKRGVLGRGFIPTHTKSGQPNGAVLEFRLRDESRVTEAQLVLDALWLALSVGGIGARTRRGFGGLRVVGCHTRDTAPLPVWVSQTWVATQPLAGVLLETHRNKCFMFKEYQDRIPTLVDRIRGAVPGAYRSADHPSIFPTIGVPGLSFFHSCRQSHRTWNETASNVSSRLREFRACNMTDTDRRNTPEWDRVVCSDESNDFPLGLFGLPVNFQERLSGGERNTFEVNLFDRSGQATRRSSPIWFRFIPIVSGSKKSFVTVTFAFANQLTDNQHDVRLVAKPKNGPHKELARLTTDAHDLRPMFDAWSKWLEDPELSTPDRPEPRSRPE